MWRELLALYLCLGLLYVLVVFDAERNHYIIWRLKPIKNRISKLVRLFFIPSLPISLAILNLTSLFMVLTLIPFGLLMNAFDFLSKHFTIYLSNLKIYKWFTEELK